MTNKFNKIVSALVLCGATTFASASNLQIDPTHTPSGTLTTVFDSITADDITPLSAYFDLDSNGITTGDLVFDSAYGQQFGGLNPTGNDLDFNIAPTGWTLFVDYEFYGAAIVNDGSLDSNGDGFADADMNKNGTIGDIIFGTTTDLELWNQGIKNFGNADGILDVNEELAAQFTGGYINVFLDAPYTTSETDGAFSGYDGIGARDLAGTDSELVMHFDVSGSALDGLSIQIFSELTMLVDNFLYSDQAGGDILDYMNESTQNKAYGTFFSELTGLETPPETDSGYVISTFQNAVLNNLSGTANIDYNDEDLTVRTRETTLKSANLQIDVPEPGSIALFGLALIGFAGAARRKFS